MRSALSYQLSKIELDFEIGMESCSGARDHKRTMPCKGLEHFGGWKER